MSCGNAKIRSQARIMIMLNSPAAVAAGPSDLRFQWANGIEIKNSRPLTVQLAVVAMAPALAALTLRNR